MPRMPRDRDVAPRASSAGTDGAGAPQLPRNYLAACLLLLLSRGPTHGYALLERLATLGAGDADTGQVYRALRGLERDGLVVSCWQGSGAGPARRTYYVTDKGAVRLEEWADGMAANRRALSCFLARYQHAAGSSRGRASA